MDACSTKPVKEFVSHGSACAGIPAEKAQHHSGEKWYGPPHSQGNNYPMPSSLPVILCPSWAWGDGSVGEELALQTREPAFDS